eukprot:CAMPEP_0203645038 /NCGR_PEP_ID=MMETSP0088-20131115/10418_1 /ASSEMBLY_ACC=CAM_ASM_001087 /TAXON_ID=426623 /ORGANISM="Chaetoceros affinis, Strain CCMP159" /LENGTH=92 /DNA_ID=CAMNT_0050501715 /DNA_START=437 /DNA_END=715 /DNA_ORIENTATION=-
MNRFVASINTVDSFGRYPIDVSVRHGLAWDDGMKEVVERSYADLLVRQDASTGLLPYMVAAVGGESDYNVGAVFHLIKNSPLLYTSNTTKVR